MLSLPDQQRRADPPRRPKKRPRAPYRTDALKHELTRLEGREETLVRRLTATATAEVVRTQQLLACTDNQYLERLLVHLFHCCLSHTGTFIASSSAYDEYRKQLRAHPFRIFSIRFRKKGQVVANLELNESSRAVEPPFGWGNYQIRLFFNDRDLSSSAQVGEFFQFVSLHTPARKKSHLVHVLGARPPEKEELDFGEESARYFKAQLYMRIGFFIMELSDGLNAALPEAHRVCEGRFIHQLIELALLGE